MKELSHQEGQFVCILTYCRNARGSGPVVIQVALLVRQHLQMINLQAGGIVDNVIRGRRNRALTDRLRHQVEIGSENKQTNNKQMFYHER